MVPFVDDYDPVLERTASDVGDRAFRQNVLAKRHAGVLRRLFAIRWLYRRIR